MTLHLTNPTRRLIVALLAIFSMVVAALPTAFLTPAFGDHFTGSETLLGGFEIDGDFTPGTRALTPPGGTDWTNVGVVTAADDLDAPNDDLINGKESDPSGWNFHTGTSNPAKNDILRTFFASDIYTDPVTGDRPFMYLGYEYVDAPGQGATTINFELNQNTTTGGAIVDREAGDLLITYDYPGGEAPVEIETFKWNGSAWLPSANEIVAGDVNGVDRAWPDVAPFSTTSESTTVKAQHFGEVAVDLRSVVGDACITVGSAWSKTRTSGENDLTSELTDYIKPVNVPPINTCGSIEVHKEDENQNLLDGATFELWMDDETDAPNTGTFDAGDTRVDTCVTGETGQDDGTCLWDDLEPGLYWVVEVAAPTYYLLNPADVEELPDGRDGVVHEVTLASLDDYVVERGTFTNPRIPYGIDVREDSTNLVGQDHTFTVTLTTDPDGNGLTDGKFDTPVAGADVDLVWARTSGSDSTITAIGDGSADSLGVIDSGGLSGSCVTDASGQCYVTVSAGASGMGRLTASFDTPYQFSVGTEADYRSTDSAPSVEEYADKGWLDFDASVTPDTATNLTGDPHDFWIQVTRTDSTSATYSLNGLEVTYAYWGPGATSPTLESCTTAAMTLPGDSSTTDGVCKVTKDPDVPGSARIVIASINVGDVDGDTVDDIVDFDYDGDGPDEDDGLHGAGDDAAKDWIDFNVVVGPDAENLVGEDHTFFIEVSSTDTAISLNGHTVNYSWAAPGATAAEAGSCETRSLLLPGDNEPSDGTCEVTFGSDVTGKGVITITSLVLTEGTVGGQDSTVEFDVTGETGPAPDTATKTWIDYQVTVSPETDENLARSNHVFTVLVEKDSGDGKLFQPLAEAKPSLAILSGPGSVVPNGDLCASTGTDTDGECTVTITSTETGTTTVRASYLGAAADSAAQTFTSGPATKKWVDYAIDVDPDQAVNPVGTTHTFTVTLQRIEDGVASAAADESVALGITGPGDIIEVPGGTIATDARSGSCTTDANGRCTVTIASDDVGDTTLTATYDAVVGESTGTFSDSGLKLWQSDPAIELVKQAEIEPTAEGLKIINCNEDGCPTTTFTFVVTNVGEVALHDVTLTDDKFGPITLEDTELEVGESAIGTATYVPSREEIDAGVHENLGTVTGVSPDGQTVKDDDPEEVQILEVLPLRPIERPDPPAPTPLPRTGADVAWLTVEGLLALLIGWAMVWVGRRKRDAHEG